MCFGEGNFVGNVDMLPCVVLISLGDAPMIKAYMVFIYLCKSPQIVKMRESFKLSVHKTKTVVVIQVPLKVYESSGVQMFEFKSRLLCLGHQVLAFFMPNFCIQGI